MVSKVPHSALRASAGSPIAIALSLPYRRTRWFPVCSHLSAIRAVLRARVREVLLPTGSLVTRVVGCPPIVVTAFPVTVAVGSLTSLDAS